MSIIEVLLIIWFFLPAGVANSSPILAAKLGILEKLNYPIDFKKSFRGKRVLGDHKTIRGLVVGFTLSLVTVHLQNVIIPFAQGTPFYMLGFALGLGALSGDMIKSFFKRRTNLAPGAPWVPFDQIDYIIGASIFSYFVVPLGLSDYLVFFVVGVVGHFASNILAYKLKIKDVWY